MTTVIKKKGSKETFSNEKIKESIRKAVRDAGLKVEDKNDMINKISLEVTNLVMKQNEIKSADIRKMVIDRLKKADARVAKSWENYEKKKKAK